MADEPSAWDKFTGVVKSVLQGPIGQNIVGGALGAATQGDPYTIDRFWTGIEQQKQRKALKQLAHNLGYIKEGEDIPPNVTDIAQMAPQYQVTAHGVYKVPSPYVNESQVPSLVPGTEPTGTGQRSETALRIYAAEHPEDATARRALEALDEHNKQKRRESIEDAAAKAGAGAKARLAAELGGTMPVVPNGSIPVPSQPTAPSDVPTAPQRNISALSGVNQSVQDVVRALVDYRIPLPSGFALRSPYWQQVLRLATEYDPTFDATQYQIRMRTRQDFTSGQSARAINSLNTVVGHLDTLQKRARELAPSWSPAFNTVKNLVRTQQGSALVKNFTTARDAVANELTRVFRNTGGTESDIRKWSENISAAGSPEQLQGAIDQALDLMDSRLDALRSQYEKGMGRPLDFTILNSRSQEILDRMRTERNATSSGDAGADNSGGSQPRVQWGYDAQGNLVPQ